MIFENNSFQFKLLCSQEEGMSQVGQNQSLTSADGPLKGAHEADQDALDRPPNVTDALRYVTYFLFYLLQYLILK